MDKVAVILVNFCDWALMPPEIELEHDEIQQAVNAAWQIAIKPKARKRDDCERNSVVW